MLQQKKNLVHIQKCDTNPTNTMCRKKRYMIIKRLDTKTKVQIKNKISGSCGTADNSENFQTFINEIGIQANQRN